MTKFKILWFFTLKVSQSLIVDHNGGNWLVTFSGEILKKKKKRQSSFLKYDNFRVGGHL